MLFLANNFIRAKEGWESIFSKTTDKPGENLKGERAMGGRQLEESSNWHHVSGMKYPKKIPLCDTNTLILPTIVIIIDKLFLPVLKKKKLSGITDLKKLHVEGWQHFEILERESHNKDSNILKLWGIITMYVQ